MGLIQFCPSCGDKAFSVKNEKHWRCQNCGFQYFHNMASAVAGIIVFGDEILLTKRKFEPGKGMLDLPGGFVDYGESLEQAMARECEEELGVAQLDWQYLFSFPNQYLYAEVLYHTQDAFFLAEVANKPLVLARDDVAEALWVKKQQLDFSRIAFESVKRGLKAWLESQG
ncbi:MULTISPECIES: NUDIX hydrolase [Thiomicrorhabdus]|uniref:NUDIX domain-containing protein n=1 Tax=Thiomicrorhabdus heinhorstiae TaxID=2748010 RepID=A0ABS0BUH3_9GAMM|nr:MULTISPECIES: NUDIX domain-containing protein [Thiomicrorhabdus]MBF6057487.1 NUDIX domain-containing protein [Thiomicrorhabdus heinhorstiae]